MRTVSTLVSAAALLLPLGCFPEVPGYDEIPEVDEDSDGANDEAPDELPDEPQGDTGSDDEGEPDADEPEPHYSVNARTRVTPAEARAPLGFDSSLQPASNLDCPFYANAEPCHTLACWLDPTSQACIDVVIEYCTANPEDPGCQLPIPDIPGLPDLPDLPPPPDGDGDDPDPNTPDDPLPPGQDPDRDPWACELEPDLPPCAACMDGTADSDACAEAWHDYCEENRTSVWCEHDEPEPPSAVFPPASLEVLVYEVAFSMDAQTCANPVVIGQDDDPHYVDFATSPELFSGDLPPAGEYPCVIITMSDHILWSVQGDNRCAGAHEQDIQGHDGVEETVRLYLSTAGDRDGDAFAAPGIPLDGALVTGEGILSSTFEIAFPQGVELRFHDDVPHCDLQQPDFSFVSDE